MNATVQVDFAVSDRLALLSMSRNIQIQKMMTGITKTKGSHCIGEDAGTGGEATIKTNDVMAISPCRDARLFFFFRGGHPLDATPCLEHRARASVPLRTRDWRHWRLCL
jgi:hypothetical protein